VIGAISAAELLGLELVMTRDREIVTVIYFPGEGVVKDARRSKQLKYYLEQTYDYFNRSVHYCYPVAIIECPVTGVRRVAASQYTINATIWRKRGDVWEYGVPPHNEECILMMHIPMMHCVKIRYNPEDVQRVYDEYDNKYTRYSSKSKYLLDFDNVIIHMSQEEKAQNRRKLYMKRRLRYLASHFGASYQESNGICIHSVCACKARFMGVSYLKMGRGKYRIISSTLYAKRRKLVY